MSGNMSERPLLEIISLGSVLAIGVGMLASDLRMVLVSGLLLALAMACLILKSGYWVEFREQMLYSAQFWLSSPVS